MSKLYGYVRLLFASWLVMGGIGLPFYPPAAATERDSWWRERQLASVPSDRRAEWVADRDDEDARAQGAVRLAGVVVGGLGLTTAMLEVVALLTAARPGLSGGVGARRSADDGFCRCGQTGCS